MSDIGLQALRQVTNQGHCPVQIYNIFFYFRHKLIGAGHCVRYTKDIDFKA